MNLLKIFCLFLVLTLAGCAATPQKDPLETVRATLPELPGAKVSADGMQISYPDDSLFAEGSVLPLPGGMSVLDPLIDFLLANPELTITGTVRSAGHNEEYDRLLVGRRLEILTAVFTNRGIEDNRLQLVMATGDGAPLEIMLQLPDSPNSSGEN